MSRHQPHTDHDLDPTIAAELDALEAALAGTPSADPELLALVAAVREDAVPPTMAFRQDLDEQVAAGFPRRRSARSVPTWLWARRAIAGPAAAVAASALIALVVVAGGSDNGTVSSLSARQDSTVSETESSAAATTATSAPSTSAPGDSAGGGTAADSDAFSEPQANQLKPGTAGEDAARQSAPSPSTVAPSAGVAVPPSAPKPVVPGRDRKVERSTQLALRTNARSLQRVSDGVVRVTQTAGGVVQQSSVDATDRGGTSDFTLTVPSGKADLVVTRLSKLAHVASMSQATNDITAGFVNFEDQLSDARAERAALLKALKGAKTEEGIARLKSRIVANRDEIARLKGQLAGLKNRADNVTLSVTVTASGGAVPKSDNGEDEGGAWSPADAAGDALRVLEVAAGVMLIALAVMVPLGVITLPAWFGARAARRRRREQALDPA
ncbi:hypothetical protein DSM112329_05180 [Paraconexibacter sp. AEG42_29]|uniref:DUF4349 domain-containing protein n=1 Tax=Paraconexibacter sp. AEG42_29 TaxID=2997339 RepID=A0AAU7B3N7_9ACTN